MRSDLNFINRQFVVSQGPRIAVYNPATGDAIGHVSAASANDAVRAVEAARSAQGAWRKLPAAERGVTLNRFADAIEARAPVIGAVLAAESGKSVADATAEAQYAAEILCYHAQWARRIEGEVIPSDSANENLVLMREPIGVAALNGSAHPKIDVTLALTNRHGEPLTLNTAKRHSEMSTLSISPELELELDPWREFAHGPWMK